MVIQKRKKILINPKFQIRIGLYLLGAIVASTFAFPITIEFVFRKIVSEVAPWVPHTAEHYENIKIPLQCALMAFWAIFTSAGFIICIFLTHRVAGPIYKLTKYLKDFTTIGEAQPLYFRKHDYFLEVPAAFNTMLEGLQTKTRNHQAVLDEINHTLSELSTQMDDSKKAVVQDVCRKLSSLENL
jgi:methyl-accepting chemotaxis protein